MVPRTSPRALFTNVFVAATFACATVAIAQTDGAFGPSNPFYASSTLPFRAPPFDRIPDADYRTEC